MLVWLWDAGTALGITDNPARARHAARARMRGDSVARVEQAEFVLGAESLTDGYRRTGDGWAGRQRNGSVTWTPFTSVLAS